MKTEINGFKVKMKADEVKFIKNVLRLCSAAILLANFLVAFSVVTSLVPLNPTLSLVGILFTIYVLVILRTDKVGTKRHLQAGLILVGACLFYSFETYTLILSAIVGFAVFISYINGRELQSNRK